jgi:hypothetical membrane protein
MVITATAGFAWLRPDYSHIRNTISELGEYGSTHSRVVSLGIFIPAGLLTWIACVLAIRTASSPEVKISFLLILSLGAGYIMAGLFPCDPGSPLYGTLRQQIHNFFGLIEYAGTSAGLILGGLYLRKTGDLTSGLSVIAIGTCVFFLLVGLSLPSMFPVRGAIQRVAEILMFSGTIILLKNGLTNR